MGKSINFRTMHERMMSGFGMAFIWATRKRWYLEINVSRVPFPEYTRVEAERNVLKDQLIASRDEVRKLETHLEIARYLLPNLIKKGNYILG